MTIIDFVRVERTAAQAFVAEFESEQELLDEHRANLSIGALRLPTSEKAALNATLLVTLRGPWGGEAFAKATVVALLPDALALTLDGDPQAMLARLLANKPAATEDEPREEKSQNTFDRMRALSQMEKLLLAVKADRPERAVLIQDSDPRVLLSVLRNPRLTVDEVVRVAKSSFLTYQIADVIVKTGQWMANLDVRIGLMHNPKTPPQIAMRILPSLPEGEIRSIARGGMNMQLKQAALKLLQGKK